MMALRQFAQEPAILPTRTTWYMTDLAEARGKQDLFTCQSPQKLKALREYALVEQPAIGLFADLFMREVAKERYGFMVLFNNNAGGSGR